MELERAYAFRIVRTARLLRLHFTRFAERTGFDVTQEQWLILAKLAPDKSLSQIELGDTLIHDKPNITRILAGMEKKKWIKRRTDGNDRRVTRVELSPAGRQLHDSFMRAVSGERDKIYAGLNEADFFALTKILNQLEKNIVNEI